MPVDKILSSDFPNLFIYFLVFSCIKVGENDPNVILKCATTSGSVIRVQNGDSLERICDKCLALIFVRFKKKYHYFPFTQLLILISPPSFSRRSPIAKALVGRGDGWKLVFLF